MSKVNEILMIAYKEFLIKGYKNTSLSSIAEKLNITKPALYYHFKNKKELYLKVVETYNNKLFDELQVLDESNKSCKEKIKKLISQYYTVNFSDIYDSSEENYHHYYFLVDGLHHFEEVKEIVTRNMNSISAIIIGILKDGIVNGELRSSLDLEIVMFHIGVLIEGLGAIYLLSNEELDSAFDKFFEYFWQSISTSEEEGR